MSKNFKFSIDGSERDLRESIEVNELQEYDLVLDPLSKMEAEIFIDENKISNKFWKNEEPGYIFKGKHTFIDIGINILKLNIDGNQITQKIRINPVKITQQDYETILDDIKKEVYNIVFSVFGHTVKEIRLGQRQEQRSNMEFFFFFEKNFKAFRDIFGKIEKDPNRGLKKETKIVDIYEADNFDDIEEFEKTDRIFLPIQEKLRGFLPKKVTYSEDVHTYDVYENRLLKHFLGLIIHKLSYLEKVALEEKKRKENNQDFFGNSSEIIEKWDKIISGCRLYRKSALNMWAKNFVRESSRINVIKTSMVLQKEPRYKTFYKLYQDFRKNSILEINSDYFYLPIRQAWDVYEIWVFLKVYNLLRNFGFELREQHLIDVDASYNYDIEHASFDFKLRENRSLLELKKGDILAKLYYRRVYPVHFEDYGSVIPFEKKPDIVIEIFKNKEKIPEIVIFDPKYRIIEEKPPEAPLKDMSHYVNTIQDKYGNRIVKNAYIIYPGKFTERFSHGNIGYIGLTPTGDTTTFEKTVKELLPI